ncbi:hypothetical protein AXF42_Ash008946 [Apostasia shenzhenica]|uniref:Uncharacterized protein n=1 Tax=Apostasia shenzhenica TaxID=1088818 RepID=A0A2I0ASZ4_9ASPA|nr:hypothetical protein AXF42_Ash008946 [Apostasia shenzhenica]
MNFKTLTYNSSSSTHTASVTGIISRFFSWIDEMDSCSFHPEKIHRDAIPEITPSIPLPDLLYNRTVDSDTDTMCSVAKQLEDKTTGRTEFAGKMRKPISSGIIFPGTWSCRACKHEVGKRVVQAASSIQIKGRGKRSRSRFLRCGKLTTSDSDFLVKKNAFGFDDYAD